MKERKGHANNNRHTKQHKRHKTKRTNNTRTEQDKNLQEQGHIKETHITQQT